MINKLAKEIHQNSKDHGFWKGKERQSIPLKLCLIHSEVSEALEADRKGHFADMKAYESCLQADDIRPEDKELYENQSFEALVKNSFEDELADAMIRIMDLAERKGINLEKHILAKMDYNSKRPHKHGKKY